MSAFAQTTDGSQTSAEVQETTNQEDFLAQLVENKGEQWKDPQVLAKGKLESDKFIEQLKGELEELRVLKSQKDFSDELLAKLQEVKAPVEPEARKNDTANTEANTTPTESDIASLVEKTLSERTQKEKQQANISAVDSALTAAYGTEAKAKVEETATKLGLSVDRMKEIAAESPDAFMSMMGQPPVKSGNPTVNTKVNTEASMGKNYNQRNLGYYEEMRKKDPKKWASLQIQQEMVASQKTLGSDFFSS